MREVKYRLWCKIKGLEKMYYLTGFDIKNSKYDDGRDCVIIHIFFGERSKTLFSTDQVELMQYTGLKDKNNIDIYEGDCIGNKHNVVEFCNGGFCINGDTPLAYVAGKQEIICNIYETKQTQSLSSEEINNLNQDEHENYNGSSLI